METDVQKDVLWSDMQCLLDVAAAFLALAQVQGAKEPS